MLRIFHVPTPRSVLLCAGLTVAALQLAGCSSREERAKDYYNHGMSYLKQKDYVKARIELRNAVQSTDNMVEAWRGLAEVDEHDHDYKSLIGDLRRIVELDPKDLKTQVQLARLYLAAGAADEAAKNADVALALDPKNGNNLALKAAILFRQKDNDGATKMAQKALEIDPNNTDASVVLAVQQLSHGDAEGALKALANVKGEHKDELGVLLLEANIFERLGNPAKVEELLKRVIELNPKVNAFRAQLIKFYITQKRPDDALKEQRAIVAANSADVTAEMSLVNLLGALQGPDAARKELVARIGAGGNVFAYQLALAKLDFSRGNVTDSTKLLEQLISSSKVPDEVSGARTALAEMYLAKNNVALAEPLITEILKNDSNNVDGLRLRAAIRIERGQIDDAISDLRTALNGQPNSPALLGSLALAYERSGSIDLANKALFDATKASGFAPAVGLNYVAFLRRRGLGAEADKTVADLASRNATSIPVLSALAQVKLAHQDWAGAHQVAAAIHNLDNKNELADQINSAAFNGEKKFGESLALLKNIYESHPGSVQPLAAMVGVYLQEKQIDKAEAAIKDALKTNPNDAEALVLLGSISLAKSDPKQAEASFQDAITKKPKDTIGYRALTDLYMRERRVDDALETVRSGLEQQPKDFALRLILAGILEQKGEFEAAISEYEAMLKDQPGSMIAANNLASLLADHRTDKASLDRASALAAVLAKSQVPQFKDTLGWVAYRRGDYSAAVPLLESAAQELPNVPSVRFHLGMSYLTAGDAAKASEQFTKARALAPNDADLAKKIDAALKTQAEKSAEKPRG
jgi:Tfp pilus assembly protein PilF